MSHMVTVSIPDCRRLEVLRERLEGELRAGEFIAEDEETKDWLTTIDSILAQAVEDGY